MNKEVYSQFGYRLWHVAEEVAISRLFDHNFIAAQVQLFQLIPSGKFELLDAFETIIGQIEPSNRALALCHFYQAIEATVLQ